MENVFQMIRNCRDRKKIIFPRNQCPIFKLSDFWGPIKTLKIAWADFQDKNFGIFNFLAFFLIKMGDILGVSDFLSCWNSLPKNIQLSKEVRAISSKRWRKRNIEYLAKKVNSPMFTQVKNNRSTKNNVYVYTRKRMLQRSLRHIYIQYFHGSIL